MDAIPFQKKAYFITIVLVALSSIIRIWPLHMLGSNNQYLTYYPTILIAAIVGGFFAGLLATLVACLIVSLLWWLIANQPFVNAPSDGLAMAFFAFNGVFMSSLAECMRRTHRRLQVKREQLELALNISQQGCWDLIQDIALRKNNELALQRMTSKMNALLEATPDCLIISNKEGDIVFANAVTEQVFGYTSEELMGQKVEFLMPDRYLKQHVSHRHHYFESAHLRPMGSGLELYGKGKNGQEFPVEISISPLETDDDLVVLATIRDITERKKSDDAKGMLLALVESSDEAIIGKDLKGIIFSWNKAAESLYGYTEAEMIGSSIEKLFSEDKTDEFHSILHKVAHGLHIKHMESYRVHKDGHTIPVSITISPIKNAKGDVVGGSTTAHDITQQKIFEEKLKHLAEHDPLTGLINRTLFEDRMEQAMALSKRQKDSVAVCFLDVDDFKYINDQYGHRTGDLLLCSVAERLQTCIRDSDTLARLGGDEFAVILLGLKKEQDVIKIAEKMIQRFSEKFLIENKTITVTLSIGISLCPEDDHESLMEKADSAMYYVKKHGKNNVKRFDPVECKASR